MTGHIELPLVLFTVLSQAAIGLALVTGLRTRSAQEQAHDSRKPWLLAACLLLAGLAASLPHLGHPLSAPMALKHIGASWLSREVLLASLLVVLLLFAGLKGADFWLGALCSACGLAALFAQAMTYAPESYPALAGGLPALFFLVTAVALGAGITGWFTPQEMQRPVARLLAAALLAGVAIFAAAPLAWLSGGAVQHMTAWAYLSSPLYWAHILLGLALPLAVVWRTGRIPAWLPVLLFAGALCGRAVFFMGSVHSAANLGGLY